jgi:hypothetical protein
MCADLQKFSPDVVDRLHFGMAEYTWDDRLNAWLAWHGGLPPKGAWRELADELGVTPEALYRALARRRRTASTGMDSRVAIAAGKGLA